jgi:hypothetical protein
VRYLDLIDLPMTILLFFIQKDVSLSTAQYWKVSKTNNLVNKSGKWQFSSLKWSLPEENCEGPITDNASGKVLDIVDQESLVELVEIEDASLLSNGQKWIKAKQNKDGWFMLINPSSNKVLTALTATATSISGFYNNPYIFLYKFLTFYYFLSTDCCEGYVEDVSGKVMGHHSGIEAQPKSKDPSIADEQKWIRSCDVGNNYFTLTNPISGKLLTAKDETSVTAEGNYL